MIDIVDPATRSRMMANIRSSNTKPEVLTRQSLHRLGYRYRLGRKIGRFKPDVVLVKWKVAIFVHGCYWHKHHGCKLAYEDREYSEKWTKKFEENQSRDKRVSKQLLEQGWRVATIWECATRIPDVLEKEILDFDRWVRGDSLSNSCFESSYKER